MTKRPLTALGVGCTYPSWDRHKPCSVGINYIHRFQDRGAAGLDAKVNADSRDAVFGMPTWNRFVALWRCFMFGISEPLRVPTSRLHVMKEHLMFTKYNALKNGYVFQHVSIDTVSDMLLRFH